MSSGELAAGGPAAPAGPARFQVALARHPTLVQVVRYALVGGLGTAVNAAIFLVLRVWWDPLPANLLALVLSTVVSTEANRRFTFGGAMAHRWRAHVQYGGTVAFYAGYSSAVLMVLHALVDNPTPPQESLAIAVASVLGGAGRFLLLRQWVFDRDGVSDHEPIDIDPPERLPSSLWQHTPPAPEPSSAGPSS